MTYFIDTNVFLRTIVNDSDQYEKSLFFLDLAQRYNISLTINSIVLSEINWTLNKVYGATKTEITAAIQSILDTPNISITNDIQDDIALAFYKTYNIKFVDCQIASSSNILEGKQTIVSWDKEFTKLPVKHLTPVQAIKFLRK